MPHAPPPVLAGPGEPKAALPHVMKAYRVTPNGTTTTSLEPRSVHSVVCRSGGPVCYIVKTQTPGPPHGRGDIGRRGGNERVPVVRIYLNNLYAGWESTTDPCFGGEPEEAIIRVTRLGGSRKSEPLTCVAR
ncbi:hypothetical protein R1flu_024651 [Riccia fluitans]|uniref:Uncharacterized protein n=1 Tax=Riccia fluitans TaxID=41844 RepID=A0ABD1XVZ1_9MARC